ncbi:RHS repeat-associated core domain-containing protein [Pseudomonas sp. ERMR1:02]|uniref:RHS repeat-associated core domain-containing protein n=1 Tax=unclassified Pseudomonas TaxID=196821 RepID=UPI003530EBAD
MATEIQGALHYSIFQQGERLLAEQQSEGGALDTTLLATDMQRSVLQTLKANHPRRPIAYTPYGYRHAENDLTSLLGFNGERLDSVTSNYLLGNGYRAFNPWLMRFNSPDSLSPFEKGGLNAYTYCLGDPINRLDPNGHLSFKTAANILTQLKKLRRQAANALSLPPQARIQHIKEFYEKTRNNHRNLLISNHQKKLETPNLQSLAGETIRTKNISPEGAPKRIIDIINLPGRKDFMEVIDMSWERSITDADIKLSTIDFDRLELLSKQATPRLRQAAQFYYNLLMENAPLRPRLLDEVNRLRAST